MNEITNKKVVGFGDLLLRLSPPGYLRFLQATTFEINYTGAEANVLVNLALNGIETDFITKLPQSAISGAAISTLKKFGVGTSKIVYGDGRLGTYYLEKGASQRPSQIIYDRKPSTFCDSTLNDYDWRSIFSGVNLFHLTGITPALGGFLPEISIEACKIAKEMGLIVTFDLNYRSSLWAEIEAQKVMAKIIPNVDYVIGNEEDSSKMLGFTPKNIDVQKGIIDSDSYWQVAQQIVETYGCKGVAFTLRESISASENNWSGIYFKDGKKYQSKRYHIHLIDRVGGGDSFSAGFIYSLLNNFDPQTAIEYAVGASCLKQTTEMDFNLSTHDEVFRLIGGDESGRILR